MFETKPASYDDMAVLIDQLVDRAGDGNFGICLPGQSLYPGCWQNNKTSALAYRDTFIDLASRGYEDFDLKLLVGFNNPERTMEFKLAWG